MPKKKRAECVFVVLIHKVDGTIAEFPDLYRYRSGAEWRKRLMEIQIRMGELRKTNKISITTRRLDMNFYSTGSKEGPIHAIRHDALPGQNQ